MKKAEKLVLESPLATDTKLLRLWAELAVATVEDFLGEKKATSVCRHGYICQHRNFPPCSPSLEVTERRITPRLE